MNTHADKIQENKSQTVAAETSQMRSGGESTLQFVANRPEAIAQRKLQEMANNSPRAMQLKAFQDMANNSPQVRQTSQLQAMADNHSAQQPQLIQNQKNNTGLSDNLKTGIENLSGYSMDDVKVHRNSDKPAQLQAHAYAQGSDIHLGPGQEKHLPHEAWHVVQQKQGRVNPTMQMKGKVNVNDDAGLEKEADVMGARAVNMDVLKTPPKMVSKTSQALQLKAYVGQNFENPKNLEEPNIKALHEDSLVRRFKDQNEAEQFAENKALEGMGNLSDGTWVRLPTNMLVLGEDHGDQLAPDIIKKTGIKKFRYEGFTHHNEDRLNNNEDLRKHVDDSRSGGLEKRGLEESEEEPSHDAEDAFPKYARTLADVIELVDKQRSNEEVSGVSLNAGTNLGAEYSLVKALLSGFKSSLIYCKSYSSKFFSHDLKTFYRTNNGAVDTAITMLQSNMESNTVPDFTAMDITAVLNDLTTVYEKLGKKEVGLDKLGKLKSFKETLDTKDESKVAIGDRAKENDYLRDASMIKTIREAKGSGDRLFVIGDAHRQKLALLIKKEGLDVKKDKEFVEEQLIEDIQALKKDKAPVADLSEPQIKTIIKKILDDIKVVPGQSSDAGRRKAGIDRTIKPALSTGENGILLKKFDIDVQIGVTGGKLNKAFQLDQTMPKITDTEKTGDILIKLIRKGEKIGEKKIIF
jgi:hypothetical protein